eukprot:gene4185-5236_t
MNLEEKELNIPESWEDNGDDNSIENSITSHINRVVIDRINLQKEIEASLSSTTPQKIISTTTTDSNNKPNSTDYEEEPLILINFTKWSNGKIFWNREKKQLENKELFEKMVDRLQQQPSSTALSSTPIDGGSKDNNHHEDTSIFSTMTADLMERELAFHTTSKLWKDDTERLEKKYPGAFFSSVSYPMVLGGFDVDSMWKKIKERTEWKSVNILKCIYLAKTNRPLLYKHNMALALEFLALEQKLLGPTAKKMKEEEDLEDEKLMKLHQEKMQRKYESEINKGIISNLQNQIYMQEGIKGLEILNNNTTIQNHQRQQQLQQQQQQQYEEQDSNDDDEEVDSEPISSRKSTTTTNSSPYESDDEADNEREDEDDGRDDDEEETDITKDGKIRRTLNNNEELDNNILMGVNVEEQEEQPPTNEEDEDSPPQPSLNVLDKIIAMVFSKITIDNDNVDFHYKMLARLHESIKESWIEEFGCLPPNCLWREDMDQ